MKVFTLTLLLAVSLGSVQATEVSYQFPPTGTNQFVHGLCVMGATSAHAKASPNSVSYTPNSNPFGNGVKLWGDRKYVTKGIEGPEMCEGGIYLEPNKHKSIRKGTRITVGAHAEAGKPMTVCTFTEPGRNRDGRWDAELVKLGFSVSKKFEWSDGRVSGYMRSFCHVIGGSGGSETESETKPEPAVKVEEEDDVCASGEYGVNGHYYEVVQYKKGTMTWHAAKAAAEERKHCDTNGHLVTMTSQGESDFVLGLITDESCGTSHDTWIGLRDDRKEGTFEWVTGEPYDWHNWCPGQPDNGGNEDFGEIWIKAGKGDGCWNDNQADLRGSANGADNDKFIVEYPCRPTDEKESSVDDTRREKTPQGSSSGDPHFKTWMGDKFDYHGECDLVLVDDPSFADGMGLRLHIRTTRVKYFSFIEKAALQVGDDVLEFNNDVDDFLINGSPVEKKHKHHTTMLGNFEVRRDSKAISVRLHDEGRKTHDGKNVAKIDFHMRQNGFPAVIVDAGHTDIFKGSLGLLGEWGTGHKLARDGKTAIDMKRDDATAFALEWQVRDTEPMLFKEARFPQFPTICIPPAKMTGNRLGMSAFKMEAEEACAHWQEDKDDCIFDVLATQDFLVAEEGHIVHVM